MNAEVERALTRARARRAFGAVAELDRGRIAIRGHDVDHSLELHAIDYFAGGETTTPLLNILGHAAATRGILDRAGIDALIDELVIARARLEAR